MELELFVLALDEPVPELLAPGLLAEPWFALDEDGVETEEFVTLRLRIVVLLPAPELEL